MKLARYIGAGEVAIVEESKPLCPPGGLLVRTEACGLCSGELMSWYMDSKIPHVLGHEVAGIVKESEDDRFPVGTRVFAHHHAPCMKCRYCQAARYVHCAQWRRTKLVPGGMADFFAVSSENLTDTHVLDDLRAQDAALVEPLACVCKAIKLSGFDPDTQRAAVIGLGGMGLLHLLALPGAVGFDLQPDRIAWAEGLGLRTSASNGESEQKYDVVFVCPGAQAAFDDALNLVQPGGTIVNFAPLAPGQTLSVPQGAYFQDLKIVNSYSCGPDDTAAAIGLLRSGQVRAEQVCSDFVSLEELPTAYKKMKATQILKAMVLWPEPDRL